MIISIIEKKLICTATGVIGGIVSAAFGGWDTSMTVLIVFMGIDYLSGIVVAGVFHNSNKTESGTLNSRAGAKGLFRKGGMLAIVLVASLLDMLIGTSFVRDAVVIAYIVNEAISIIENAGLMGIPIPAPIVKAIDVLKSRTENGGSDSGNVSDT